MPASINDRNRRAAQALDDASTAADAGDILKPGGGSGSAGGGFPWDVTMGLLRSVGRIDEGSALLLLRHSCGSRIRMQVTAAGLASLLVINCSGDGQLITPDGIQKVHVDPSDEGEPEPDETTEPVLGSIPVEACVDGVTKTIHLMGSA